MLEDELRSCCKNIPLFMPWPDLVDVFGEIIREGTALGLGSTDPL